MERTDTDVWFLREWFGTQGLKQRDLVTKLDWLPAKAYKIWHGIQPFRREEIVEIAALLNITPSELMMHPDEAMALRRLRSAVAEVSITPNPAPAAAPEAPAAKPKRTGTHG